MALLGYSLWPENERHPVAWGDLTARAGPLTITRETRRVFRERRHFVDYVLAVGGRPPDVDFESRQVLIVSPGPRSSTGYAVEILAVVERGGTIEVAVHERTPTLETAIEPRVTFPYRLVSLPAGKSVTVDWRGR